MPLITQPPVPAKNMPGRRPSRTAGPNELEGQVKAAYNNPLQVTIPLSGVTTKRRDGSDTGVDVNVNAVRQMLVRDAAASGLGVSIVVQVDPKGKTATVQWRGKERTLRPRKNADAA